MSIFSSDFNIQEIIKYIILAIVPYFFSITVHEYMHGLVAYKLGDNTAKDMGRLTLNPIAHIDIVGLLFLLITRTFGWAKPIPVNFNNLKHKYGMAMVAAAGPLTNLALGIITVLLIKLIEYLVNHTGIPKNIYEPIFMMALYGLQINIVLFIFNIIPILPLDGGRILCNFLPFDLAVKYSSMERYGFFIILILSFSGAIRYILNPPINFIYSLLF